MSCKQSKISVYILQIYPKDLDECMDFAKRLGFNMKKLNLYDYYKSNDEYW